jgi:hypothetical protein
MSSQNKGIYPNWVNDKDIINQVLSEINQAGGRLPYIFVVNPEHEPEIKERMKRLLDKMQTEKLILGAYEHTGFVELDVDGGMAAQLGYLHYKKNKKRDKFRYTSNRVLLIISLLIILGLAGYVVYLLMHYFRIV